MGLVGSVTDADLAGFLRRGGGLRVQFGCGAKMPTVPMRSGQSETGDRAPY
jgi:hypothetical protein